MRFLSIVLKNLLRRKVRSSLTVVSVAVAVGTMVALVSLSYGFEKSFLHAFQLRGVDLVVVEKGVPDQLRSDLDERVGDRIRQLPGVVGVAPGLVDFISIPRGNSELSVFVHGWEPDSFLFRDLQFLSGRQLRAGDTRKADLGVNLAESLKKKVGDTVQIQGEDFEVVGVYKSTIVYEDGAVAIPLREMQALMLRQGRATGFSIILDHGPGREERVEAVRDQILALQDERGRPLRVSVKATPEYVRGLTYIQMAHAMAWVTSAIALVIGSIGMLNTMIMSVLERTREIGTLRAIGWRKARVVRMILQESLLLSLAGTVVGTAGAIALNRFLTTFPAVSGFVQGDVAPLVIGEGFLLAVLVGLIGGLYPAVRAARLLPTEALRHE
jgi:putative ABC transport system permease protein